MAKCDLCGADCGAAKLAQLLEQYQTAGVVDICPDCDRWATKLKGDMLLEICPRMRSAIAVRKCVQPPRTLRQRFQAWRERTGFLMDGADGGM